MGSVSEQLHESAVTIAEATFDPESRTIRNAALVGMASANGYRYAESALRDALPMYEGKPVLLDHAAVNPQARSMKDLAGTITAPRFEGGRIRGDIRLLETDSGRILEAVAKANIRHVGMSHVVRGRRSDDRKTIEAIDDVISVDAVVFPATTDSLSEQRHDLPDGKESDMDLSKLTLAEVQQHRPDLLVELRKATEVENKHAEIVAENATLKAEVQQFKLRDQLAARKASIHAALATHKLDPADPVVCSESWMASLMDCADDAARDKRIADQAALVKHLKESAAPGATPPGTGSGMRTPPPSDSFDPKTFHESRKS